MDTAQCNSAQIEVAKFPTVISKWEYATINGGQKGEYGGESEGGGGGGGGESHG